MGLETHRLKKCTTIVRLNYYFYRDSCLLIYFQKSRSCHRIEAVPVVTAESQEQLAQMNRRIS